MAEDDEKTEGTEAEPKKSKKGLIIIIVAVLLLGGGGAGFALMSGGAEKKEGAEEVIHYEQVELDTFIVNLNENNSFLKVKMVLEYNPKLVHGDQAEGGGHGGSATGGGFSGGSEPSGPPGVLGTRAPMIKDAILRVLSSKSSKEVLSPEGKEQLKQELVEAINEACDVPEGPVVNVYFTEFIVQ